MRKPKKSTTLRSFITVIRLLMAYARDPPQKLQTAPLTEVHQELKALGRPLSAYLMLGFNAAHPSKENPLIEANQLRPDNWLANAPRLLTMKTTQPTMPWTSRPLQGRSPVTLS